jgi:hypothetical protein
MHEHDQHWAEFLQATKTKPPSTPPSVREYADSAKHEPAEHQAEDLKWYPEHDEEQDPEKVQGSGGGLITEEDLRSSAKKALIDKMMPLVTST